MSVKFNQIRFRTASLLTLGGVLFAIASACAMPIDDTVYPITITCPTVETGIALERYILFEDRAEEVVPSSHPDYPSQIPPRCMLDVENEQFEIIVAEATLDGESLVVQRNLNDGAYHVELPVRPPGVYMLAVNARSTNGDSANGGREFEWYWEEPANKVDVGLRADTGTAGAGMLEFIFDFNASAFADRPHWSNAETREQDYHAVINYDGQTAMDTSGSDIGRAIFPYRASTSMEAEIVVTGQIYGDGGRATLGITVDDQNRVIITDPRYSSAEWTLTDIAFQVAPPKTRLVESGFQDDDDDRYTITPRFIDSVEGVHRYEILRNVKLRDGSYILTNQFDVSLMPERLRAGSELRIEVDATSTASGGAEIFIRECTPPSNMLDRCELPTDEFIVDFLDVVGHDPIQFELEAREMGIWSLPSTVPAPSRSGDQFAIKACVVGQDLENDELCITWQYDLLEE